MEDYTNLQTLDSRDSTPVVNEPVILDITNDNSQMQIGSTTLTPPNMVIAQRANGATDIIYY